MSDMCGTRMFCQWGSNYDNAFLADEGREDPNTTIHYKRAIIGPPAKRHLNDVSLADRCLPNSEYWLGRFVIFKGPGPVLLRNPIMM